jgi:hypothetical protein
MMNGCFPPILMNGRIQALAEIGKQCICQNLDFADDQSLQRPSGGIPSGTSARNVPS